MKRVRKLVVLGALAALVATTVPGRPPAAEAGQPAPLPTQIPIRDISAPPTPNTPATPFTPKPAARKHRRAKPTRRHQTAHPVSRPAPRAKGATAPPAGNPAAPKLEQRFEAPTESIYPLEPEPAKGPTPTVSGGRKPTPVEFPPEPAPAPAPTTAPAPAK